MKAERIIAFNPQFQILSLLGTSTEATDPLVFRLKNSPAKKYYDIVPFISADSENFYFYSNKSAWDIEQNNWIKDLKDIHKIEFRSSHHGIPFLKVALPGVINMEDEKMKRLENNRHSPVIFTIKIVGLRKTILGFFEQFYNAYRRRR